MSLRTLRTELAVPTTRLEDMRHPSHVWTDPEFAKEPLGKLVDEYLRHLDGRSQPISPDTREKYRKSLLALMRSMERQQLPMMLESLTPAAVNWWIQEQRSQGRAEDGIASRLSAVKVFSSKYVYKHLE